jgi:hypothetical protein
MNEFKKLNYDLLIFHILKYNFSLYEVGDFYLNSNESINKCFERNKKLSKVNYLIFKNNNDIYFFYNG